MTADFPRAVFHWPSRIAGTALRRYRATGADLPFGDPLPWHGVSMEGYFWRLTDPASGRVVIALTGINTPATGPAWATVGIATEPGGTLDAGELSDAWADPQRLGIRVADEVRASERQVRMAVGSSRVDFTVEAPRRWPGRVFGGSSVFQTVPGLNQYWHPWLLGGHATGSVTIDGERTAVDGWQVYAEKNWGRGGFPTAWWWGQAQGFAERNACVAFAGGRITAGPKLAGRGLETEVTALVAALPDGRVVRLGDPLISPVTTTARPGSWTLRGRSPRWQIEVDAVANPDHSFVLPVPLVEERRNAPGDLEHLVGDLRVLVRENGRVVWHGHTTLAALEIGGRDLAEAELARRGGDPRPLRHPKPAGPNEASTD
ncbi:tocopherol cyclase family protein [Granulicoccus sp. GXG6511]|uniref:tocopherol cyclase family protein n=1 Tax=Granulicoccus sp. GXG6511 TaxID=3381351 RepID=UPI003D7CEB44